MNKHALLDLLKWRVQLTAIALGLVQSAASFYGPIFMVFTSLLPLSVQVFILPV